MSREQLFAAFFFAALLFFLYQFYRILAVFLTPLLWAGLLALVFHPLQSRLSRILRKRNGLAAFLLTGLVVALVIVPTILIASLLVSESVAAYQHLQERIESGALARWWNDILAGILRPLAEYIPEPVRQGGLDLPALALKASDAASRFLVAQATGAVRNALAFVANFFLTTVALFFFLRDGERIASYVREVIPMEPQHRDAVLGRFYDTLTAVVQGSLVTAVAQGTFAGIGYWIVGVDFAVLFGCATAFLSLLPAGAAVVWLPITVYLAGNGLWGRALLLLLWGLFVVGGVDNLIRPWIIGGRTQISTLLLFFGILGGLQVYGILGMFLAPVIIATLVALVRIYREQYGTAQLP